MRRDPKNQSQFNSFKETKPVIFLLSFLKWPRRKIRQLYDWMVGWSESKRSQQALAGFAFIESSFFPIPPDPLLIAITTIKPKQYLRLAIIATVFSILGGILGYIIGLALFESVGQFILDTYNLHEEFESIGQSYKSNAFMAILLAAFTPIPYKVITISAGVFHVNFLVFLLASAIGRGARFLAVAYLMHHLGQRYKDKIAKYIDILSLIFLLLIIVGFLSIKLIL